jgi:DNA helicase TIP49 (TBP-interacting protein)
MPIQFRKAERSKAKLRLALDGTAGSGKTYSALTLAKGLGGKTAFIDSENGSGDLYADKFDYDIVTLAAPFSP